jgi:hypothetical protein
MHTLLFVTVAVIAQKHVLQTVHCTGQTDTPASYPLGTGVFLRGEG